MKRESRAWTLWAFLIVLILGSLWLACHFPHPVAVVVFVAGFGAFLFWYAATA